MHTNKITGSFHASTMKDVGCGLQEPGESRDFVWEVEAFGNVSEGFLINFRDVPGYFDRLDRTTLEESGEVIVKRIAQNIARYHDNVAVRVSIDTSDHSWITYTAFTDKYGRLMEGGAFNLYALSSEERELLLAQARLEVGLGASESEEAMRERITAEVKAELRAAARKKAARARAKAKKEAEAAAPKKKKVVRRR